MILYFRITIFNINILFFFCFSFPLNHFGKLNGFAATIAAIGNLAQYPILLIIFDYFSGSFFYVNLVFLILLSFGFCFPLYLLLQAKNIIK